MTHAARTHEALTRRWAAGETAYGGWLVEESESALAAYAQAGFDYVGIDCQHSLLDESAAGRLVTRYRDAPFALLTRVSRNAVAPIGRLLDAGSDGIIVPGVNTVDEAEAAVAAMLYPPAGVRSFGPIRAGLGSTPAEISARALCLVMIETEAGLANVEAICAVPGVSGVYIGPADLSIALGLDQATAFTSDQLERPFARIRSACEANGLVLGAHALDRDSADRWIAWGASFVSIGSNVGLFAQAAGTLQASLRGSESLLSPTSSPYA